MCTCASGRLHCAGFRYGTVVIKAFSQNYFTCQHANGNKQIEPFIERDIQFCNRFDGSEKEKDSLIELYYDKEQKIKSLTYWNVKDKKMFSFGYDKNGNKDGVYIYDLSDTPKLTEFYFNEKECLRHTLSNWYVKMYIPKGTKYMTDMNGICGCAKKLRWEE